MKDTGYLLKNRIWMFVGMVFLILFSFYGIGNAFVFTVALEQPARCGAEEHLHTEDCYADGNLTCSKLVHTHNQNCYLVLLQDNDINQLLSRVDADQDRNLGAIIDRTVETALYYSSNPTFAQVEQNYKVVTLSSSSRPNQEAFLSNQSSIVSESESTADLSNVDVSTLNETINVYNIEPNIVLNENLYKATNLSNGPTDTAVISAGANTGVSTLAVGDSAVTGNNNANFYIYLDNQWTCIGKMNFQVVQSNRKYRAEVNTAAMLSFLNETLGSNLTMESFNLKYATSANAASRNWTDASITNTTTTFGSNYNRSNEASRAKYVRLVDANGDPLSFYSVTLVHLNGTTTTSYVQYGGTITLPIGFRWSDGSEEYSGGQAVPIYSASIFTAMLDDGKLRVSYNLNFPSPDGVTLITVPVLAGLSGQTAIDAYEESNCPFYVRNSSQRDVKGQVDEMYSTNGMHRSIYFVGWMVNGDPNEIIEPGTVLTWDDLNALAVNRVLSLTGVWEYHRNQTATFYVRYDAVAEDTEGNITSSGAQYYTNEVFNTHLFGLPENRLEATHSSNNQLYSIATVSKLNSVEADAQIRKLYETGVVFQEGTSNEATLYMKAFPNDADVIAQVKADAQAKKKQVYADDGYGNPIQIENLDDLDENHYKVRWYVFKDQSCAWHIDGKLVKKEGVIKVTKTFAGNRESITDAKSSFYIEAVSQETGNRKILRLDDEAVIYDASTDSYTWTLTGVEYGERWTFTEQPLGEDSDYLVYSEYTLVDTEQGNASSGSGTQATVSGITYALDEKTGKALTLKFNNIYHVKDSIIIKKEDAQTGLPLGGASFQLEQNGEVMTFYYVPESDSYTYSPTGNGPIHILSGSPSGYYEIMTGGFSYKNGNVTVKEVSAPKGYAPIAAVTIGYTDVFETSVDIIGNTQDAEYYAGVLVVKNNSDMTSVTAIKEWACAEADRSDSVIVQLMANGQLAAAVIPSISNQTVELSAENHYTYTWTGLPSYANGAKIVWSVREIKIGTEVCKSDYTFANWLVEYDEPVYTQDEAGNFNTSITIRNDIRRTLLHLIKTDTIGRTRLPGATFTLQHLIMNSSGVYVDDPNFTIRTQTTGTNGALNFDHLLYGRYRLTETAAPSGYDILLDPVYLTIQEDGAVVVDGHAYAKPGSNAYSIVIQNHAKLPLPETGGSSPDRYHISGGLLMLAAAYGYIFPRFKKKGRYLSSKK